MYIMFIGGGVCGGYLDDDGGGSNCVLIDVGVSVVVVMYVVVLTLMWSYCWYRWW